MPRILGLEDTIVPFSILSKEIDGTVLMAVPILVYDKCTLTVIHIRGTQDGRLWRYIPHLDPIDAGGDPWGIALGH